MKSIYVDAYAGISGDMMLGALLDLGVSHDLFMDKMNELQLPVKIKVEEVSRSSLRALKVHVNVTDKKHIQRKWTDVEILINQSPFPKKVKKRACAVFRTLFKAEARVHGQPFEETHLHDAGANDAITDILGSCFLIDILKIKSIYASPLNVGSGLIKAIHGTLPVPPPAVAEILKGRPVYSAGVKKELVTPTGAAIISTLADKFIPFPELCYDKIGCGAGTRDFKGFPNILRIFYGHTSTMQPEKQLYQIETNIDDANPQVLAGFIDKAFKLGALDVFLTPIVMKKNRLASKLTVLTEIDKMDNLIQAVFRETSSIGIRYFPVKRQILSRHTRRVSVLGENIRIKIASSGGTDLNIQPEYEDCLKTAKKKGIPVKEVLQIALNEFLKQKK